MTTHLYAVPTNVIPLPRHGLERTELAHHVLRLAAEGRIARSPAGDGWRVTVSGERARIAVVGQLDELIMADLAEWLSFDGAGSLAVATFQGARVLTGWDRAHGSGDVA